MRWRFRLLGCRGPFGAVSGLGLTVAPPTGLGMFLPRLSFRPGAGRQDKASSITEVVVERVSVLRASGLFCAPSPTHWYGTKPASDLQRWDAAREEKTT